MLGRTLGGATIASIQGTLILVVCMVAGFRPQNLALIPLALVFMLLVGLVFAGLGTAIGSTLKDMQGFQLIMNFLIMPIFFLSGALFPLNNLPTALTIATRLDPLSYGVDGLRAALIGITQFGVVINLGVLVVVASGFMVLGAWAFSRIQV
jgi:ABC-2 type transport system permease protein